MTDEFALHWNNFTENFTNGFKSFLNGDLSDCVIAVDGKILRAHKVILAMCSPYFQEIFSSIQLNQQPVIILKGEEMNARLIAKLLEFMYIGKVNIRQDELEKIIKLGETLQIKGLTSNFNTTNVESDKSIKGGKRSSEKNETEELKNKKAHIDLSTDDDSESQIIDDHFSIVPFPEISLVESRNCNVDSQQQSECSLKISEPRSFSTCKSLDFNDKQIVMDVPRKTSISKEFLTEVPSSADTGAITMLSSTSLLHGNCIFNRNNTVATQSGLKTYWLCKSYRISMCKARCITHQEKVISATGVHNHLPHAFIPSNEYLLNQSSHGSHSNYHYNSKFANQQMSDRNIHIGIPHQYTMKSNETNTKSSDQEQYEIEDI